MSCHSFEHYEPVGYYQRGLIQDCAAEFLGKHMYVSEPRPPPEKATPREGKVMRFTPGYAAWPAGTLFYFGVRGRAEPIRLIMHYAGVSYNMHTVASSDWAEMKPTMGPGQCMPAWQPDGEAIFNESLDIAKWVARESGKKTLRPDDAKASKLFEMTMSGPLFEVGLLLNLQPKDDALKAAPAKVQECLDILKKTAEADLEGPFFGGAEPHIGDFGVWACVDLLATLDGGALDKLGAKWQAWYAAVAALKGVPDYVACRPRAGTGKCGAPGSMMATMELDGPEKKVYDYEVEEEDK